MKFYYSWWKEVLSGGIKKSFPAMDKIKKVSIPSYYDSSISILVKCQIIYMLYSALSPMAAVRLLDLHRGS